MVIYSERGGYWFFLFDRIYQYQRIQPHSIIKTHYYLIGH